MPRISAIKIVTAAIMAVTVSGCGGVCSSDPIGVFSAKGSSYVALLNRKNCGATTRYAYELLLSKNGKNESDLAFRFDDDGNPSWPEDERKLVRLQLVKPNILRVHVTQPVRVFKQEKEVMGLAVTYDYKSGTKIM